MEKFLSEISGLISFTAYLIYIVSIFFGKTKPSRSTWWILTLVGSLIMFTSLLLGLKQNFWIQLSYVVGPLFIAILSVFPKYGYSEKLLGVDKVCLWLSGILCVFWGLSWFVFKKIFCSEDLLNSLLFIVFLLSLAIDFVGLVPTVIKSYRNPKGEYPFAWLLETVASSLNMYSVLITFGFLNQNMIYALYLLSMNGIITILLFRKKSSTT